MRVDRNPARRLRRLAGAAVLVGVLTLGGVTGAALGAPVLTGQWRFDEPGGQLAQDDGPFGILGILGASTVADAADPARVPGAEGGALRLDGTAYVRVPDAGHHLDLPTLTVEAVARAAASPGVHRYLVSRGSDGCFAGAYGLYTAANGGLAFYVFDGEEYFVSPSAVPSTVWDGAWHRLAGTFDGQRVRAYVDGHEVGSGIAVPPGTAVEYASMPAGGYFGTYVGTCSLPFVGDLDAVRIWEGVGLPSTATGTAVPGGPGAQTPSVPGQAGTVLPAAVPPARCAVRVSRSRILTRRRQTVTATAVTSSGVLRHVRLTIKRGSRTVRSTTWTDRRGRVQLVLRERRATRLRISVRGRPQCTPAFIRVVVRR